jgi:hypothetical protein
MMALYLLVCTLFTCVVGLYDCSIGMYKMAVLLLFLTGFNFRGLLQEILFD